MDDRLGINIFRPILLGYVVLAVGFGGFIIWASFAPLAEGVYGVGTIRIAGERKVVQTLTGGVVSHINVVEGASVTKGQVLVQMDSTQSRSQVSIYLGQWLSVKAEQARLISEQLHLDNVKWPEDLLSYASDARLQHEMELQNLQYRTRLQEFISEQNILSRKLAGLKEQLNGFISIKKSHEKQLGFYDAQLLGLRELSRNGFVAKLKVIDGERLSAQLSGSLAEDLANIGRTEQEIAEVDLKILLAQQTYRKNIEVRLSEVNKQINTLADQIKNSRFELSHTTIRAPVSGEVIDLDIHTVGAILNPGQKILEVVPSGSDFVVLAKFSTQSLDKLGKGQLVDIQFPTLNQMAIPRLLGSVKTVSADELIDKYTHQPYVNAEIIISDSSKQWLQTAEISIKPGMPVDVLINSGERTMLSYLLKPLFRRLLGSFKEA